MHRGRRRPAVRPCCLSGGATPGTPCARLGTGAWPPRPPRRPSRARWVRAAHQSTSVASSVRARPGGPTDPSRPFGQLAFRLSIPRGRQLQYGQDYSNGKARWVRTVVLCMGCHAIMGDGAAPENPPAAGAPDPRVAELEGQLQKATEEIAALAAENQRLRLENQVQAPA